MDTLEPNFQKNCPECDRLQTYKSKTSFLSAVRNNRKCRWCRPDHWSGRKHSDETKQKISNANFGKHSHNKGMKFSDDHKQKISKSSMGNKSRTGMPHSEETKKKMSTAQKGRIISEDHKQKISKSRKGYKVPPEVQAKINLSLPRGDSHPNKRPENKEKIRTSLLKRIKNYHGSLSPFYNPHACSIFEEINKELGWNGQHAENGGEICLRGWFLDYYDKSNNVVIEYDECHHNNSKQKARDILKEKEIIEELGCKFYRIKAGQNWRDLIK
jgi:hypothetical protein